MNLSAPHYLLFSQAGDGPPGDWRFVLQPAGGSERLEVADQEPSVQGERLELLAVVRGLEALDQPSRVTLMTPSKYVRQGIRFGLPEWRRNGWRWEFFGEMVPVKNRDLWQRIERAMRFHEVECRIWRLDPAHENLAGSHFRTTDVANASDVGHVSNVPSTTTSVDRAHDLTGTTDLDAPCGSPDAADRTAPHGGGLSGTGGPSGNAAAVGTPGRPR